MAAMADLTELSDAQRLILERVDPTGPERVPVDRAAGRVLAESATARVDLPPFPSSAMDGFAVRAVDAVNAADLAVVGKAAAGSPARQALGAGQAIAISTGAVVPAGADAVVPIEDVTTGDGTITLTDAAGISAGANVRDRGRDVAEGDAVVAAGMRLGAAQVGALAAAGVADVQCRIRPRVGILVTGSELRAPGEELEPGQIYESNGLLLAAQLGTAGAVPAQLGVVVDDLEEHERTMERALLGFDMLLTTGGASVGEHDLVRKAQESLRVKEVFHGVAIKPGKPAGFGMRRSTPVFNLPGNPVSALVDFELLVRPAVGALLGLPDPLPSFRAGVLMSAVERGASRDEFVRARLDVSATEVQLTALDGQESHMIVTSAAAQALVRIPRGTGEVPAGAAVQYLTL